MKILLAEHEPMWREFLLDRLRASGLQPVVSENGEHAWTVLQQTEAPRLALISRSLPQINAMELCRRVRARRDAYYTFLFVLMPNRYPVEELIAMEAGADECLAKPINDDQLNARLAVARRVLNIDSRLTDISGHWRTLLDTLPFGVVSLDRRGNLKRINKTFASQVGYANPKDLLGTSLNQFLRDRGDRNGLLDEIRWAESFNDVEVLCRGLQGRWHRVRLWGRPLPENDEAVYEIVVQEVPDVSCR